MSIKEIRVALTKDRLKHSIAVANRMRAMALLAIEASVFVWWFLFKAVYYGIDNLKAVTPSSY